jgi:predicted enzyme involved in methoxymalonyl-ACP biosynthesis
MSCRVLGRQVEEATLNLIVEEARCRGARRLIGTYRPTAKNGMVRDHYPRLGFAPLANDGEATRWVLGIDKWTPLPTAVAIMPAAEVAA